MLLREAAGRICVGIRHRSGMIFCCERHTILIVIVYLAQIGYKCKLQDGEEVPYGGQRERLQGRVEHKAGDAAPPPEPRRLAAADKEVVQQFVALLHRQSQHEIDEAKAAS